ncbi:hypothetical protein PQQ84_32940 [Paraburkholderia strydomiana]|uniref:hypothetical protein n=1 Tax=Paraburkholderia strydomiana TaxID=1245417 RepID=UPI0038BC7F12
MKMLDASATPDSPCFRPPSWPPPATWVVSEDAEGNPVSRFEDECWDFSAYAGRSLTLEFSSWRAPEGRQFMSQTNQGVLKLLTASLLWGPRSARRWKTLQNWFYALRRTVALCDREGIVASDLMRFPKVIKQLLTVFPAGSMTDNAISVFDRLLLGRRTLGFALVDEGVISQLAKKNSAQNKDWEKREQTAYIPPRIWLYQIRRLREFLDDFVAHKERVEACYRFCISAYVHNYGTIENAIGVARAVSRRTNPFSSEVPEGLDSSTGRLFYGKFENTAREFGIEPLIDKWVGPLSGGSGQIKMLSKYLSMVTHVGAIYIANFTLQRAGEFDVLRADCLVFEKDPVIGRIAVIRGDTTKTDPDDDARWPTSPNVQIAVDAMSSVARLRILPAATHPDAKCSEYDKENPFLIPPLYEPWQRPRGLPYSTRPDYQSYENFSSKYDLLFDLEELRITEEDLTIARRFTSNLTKSGRIAVGNTWPLAYHQLRRTGAVNMFASGLLSDTSVQVLMKHLTVLQSRYYGRNFTQVRFNDEYERLSVATRYEVMAVQIESLMQARYVSPLGEEHKNAIVVNLIGEKDVAMLAKAGANGEVSYRETRLGGCTKRGHCDYGGIESVARCAGGDGEKPCGDAMYDSGKRESVKRQLKEVNRRIKQAEPNSPFVKALKVEAQALRNYLDETNQ